MSLFSPSRWDVDVSVGTRAATLGYEAKGMFQERQHNEKSWAADSAELPCILASLCELLK